MSDRNACVVGVGRLGSFHAQKYLELQNSGIRLSALVDPNRDSVQAKFPTIPVFSSIEEMLSAEREGKIEKITLASVASPTYLHKENSLKLLAEKKHLLVEKPLAMTSKECQEIIEAAKKQNLVLAVGHVERHRAMPVLQKIQLPRFVECHRLAPFSNRSTDIDVVLDLMIHDIDLLLSIVKSPLKFVHAAGFPVLTKKIDIANARFEFMDGCIANLTSSRISVAATRKFRVFSMDTYISLDLAQATYQIFHKKGECTDLSRLEEVIEGDMGTLDVQDALRTEVGDFVEAVRVKKDPLVTGVDALHAQELAEKVLYEIQSRL